MWNVCNLFLCLSDSWMHTIMEWYVNLSNRYLAGDLSFSSRARHIRTAKTVWPRLLRQEADRCGVRTATSTMSAWPRKNPFYWRSNRKWRNYRINSYTPTYISGPYHRYRCYEWFYLRPYHLWWRCLPVHLPTIYRCCKHSNLGRG